MAMRHAVPTRPTGRIRTGGVRHDDDPGTGALVGSTFGDRAVRTRVKVELARANEVLRESEQSSRSIVDTFAFYTSKSGGMGIGLFVGRSIVERHHGRPWAEPNDGPGATFSFSIPRAPA